MEEINIDKKSSYFSHELFNAEYVFFKTDTRLISPTSFATNAENTI